MTILKNSIRTPDGTVLVSRFTHDFVDHHDANGYYYAVDGGLDYLRRLYHPDAPPYEELSVNDDGTLETAREALEWGSLPKQGGDLVYRKLSELSNKHIQNILEDHCMGRQRVRPIMANYMQQELDFREENGILICYE